MVSWYPPPTKYLLTAKVKVVILQPRSLADSILIKEMPSVMGQMKS